MNRENAGSWNSSLEKEQILQTYSAQLQKFETSRRVILELIKNIGQIKHQRGPPAIHKGGGTPPCLVAPLAGLRCPSSATWWSFLPEKIRRKLSGRNAAVSRRNLGRTNLGLQGSYSAGKLPSGRGKSKPSSSPTILSSRGGQSPSTYSPTPSPLQTLVHLLYLISVSKPRSGTCVLLVVLITPYSWC